MIHKSVSSLTTLSEPLSSWTPWVLLYLRIIQCSKHIYVGTLTYNNIPIQRFNHRAFLFLFFCRKMFQIILKAPSFPVSGLWHWKVTIRRKLMCGLTVDWGSTWSSWTKIHYSQKTHWMHLACHTGKCQCKWLQSNLFAWKFKCKVFCNF